MRQPLVLRPPYGSHETAEAKLPQGDPAQRGVSLDPAIPGTSTFAKPSDEPAREQRKDDESIHRVDNADDLAKGPQTTPDERDHSNFKPTQAPGGKSVAPKTKYPYRDGFPSGHSASAEFVAGLYRLASVPDVVVERDVPVRIAARLSEIEQGLSPKVDDRSRGCGVTLKRADIKNLRWVFSVNCGNGEKVVRLKANRKGNVVALGKMDLAMACSCPAWRWWGAEHNSKSNQYLDGKPVGTAAPPNINDPNRVNKVCKHAKAVLSAVREWTVPVAKAKK